MMRAKGGIVFPKGGGQWPLQVVTSGRRRAWAFVGVRSVRKRGPTASQVGSGPRESRVLELGKLVCRPPGRRRRCPTQGAPRTPRVHLPSPRAPPSAMPRNAHVPPRIAPRAQIAEPPTRDEVRHDRRGVRRAARAGAPAVAAGQHRRVRVLHAVRARREPAARHHRPHHVDRMPSVLRAPRPAGCALAARRPEPQP